MNQNTTQAKRANYGIDAPYVLLALTISGLACAVIAILAPALRWLYSPAISLLATSAVWLYGSLFGKLRLRDKLINTLTWTGNEQVLDVGCGGGLLLNGAAKRLTTGMAFGVDIWRKEDLANNQRKTTLNNAKIEGVAERVTVEEGDARKLPFQDATFDTIVSLNVIHNISKLDERKKALHEIVRVLKPGGQLLLCDFRNVPEYVAALRTNGMPEAQRKFVGWVGLFPMYAAVGNEPASD